MGKKKIQKNKSNRILLVMILSLLTLVLLGSFVWFNQGREKLYMEAYIRNIQQNEDIVREKNIADVNYTCEYIPAEYNAVKLLQPNTRTELIREAVNLSRGFAYFKLSLKSSERSSGLLDPNTLDANTYNFRLQYFNAQAQENLKLLNGTDTLNCTQYMFENPYSLKSSVNLMLGFKLGSSMAYNNLQLIYNDQLFNGGLVKFHFDQNDLSQLPELIINE
jgi:hypothetical protein